MGDFMLNLFDFICYVFGSLATILLFTTGIFCSIAALLHFSVYDRVLFKRVCRIVGIVLAVFGFLLPFRKISFFGTVLCMLWGFYLFDAYNKYKFYQGIGVLIANTIFWIAYVMKNMKSGLMQHFGDILVFIILPGVFTTVTLSKQNDSLENQNEIRIPLEAFLTKLGNVVQKAVKSN